MSNIEFETLPTLNNYIVRLGMNEPTHEKAWKKLIRYRKLVSNKAKLSMFIPSFMKNGKWVIVKKPCNYDFWDKNKDSFGGVAFSDFRIRCCEYRLALKNVIFSECVFDDEMMVVRTSDMVDVIYIDGSKSSKTIEDLIVLKLKLSERGKLIIN